MSEVLELTKEKVKQTKLKRYANYFELNKKFFQKNNFLVVMTSKG
jgi:hypothetical protein